MNLTAVDLSWLWLMKFCSIDRRISQDLQTPNENKKSKNDRKNSLEEHAPSANFNPLQWSKWLVPYAPSLLCNPTHQAGYSADPDSKNLRLARS